eukprot:scaffold214557_cov22-Tisochrysis_lutea.AAC.1
MVARGSLARRVHVLQRAKRLVGSRFISSPRALSLSLDRKSSAHPFRAPRTAPSFRARHQIEAGAHARTRCYAVDVR